MLTKGGHLSIIYLEDNDSAVIFILTKAEQSFQCVHYLLLKIPYSFFVAG